MNSILIQWLTKTQHCPYYVAGAGDVAVDSPRSALLRIKIPDFNCATSFTIAVNLAFFASLVKYGVKCWMQSRVVAFGVFCSHSISILSSNSPSGAGPVGNGFRFFGFGALAPLIAPLVAPAPETSSALRLFADFPIEFVGDPTKLFPLPAAGLVVGLPETGLVARLPPPGTPLSGLFPLLTLADFTLGAFGLVARLATTECPPKLCTGAGETAWEPTAESSAVGGFVAGC